MLRKLTAIFISIVMILSILPSMAFLTVAAAEEPGTDIVLAKSKGNPVTGHGVDGALTDPTLGNRAFYVGDAAVMVDGDTVWMYAGRDAATGNGYSMPYWVAYSSKDMETWTFHGEVTSANRSNITWTNNDNSAWASQVVKNVDPELKKTYYYHYFCTGSPQNIGVAVADTPTGWSSIAAKEEYCKAKGIYIRQPDSLLFTDIGHPLIHNTVSWPYHAGHDDIDPTVWIEKDDNGETHGYIAWGNTWMWIAELNADMLSLKDQNGDGLITMKTNRSLQTRTGAVMVDHAITAANNSNNNATTQIVDVPYEYPGIRTAGTTAITYTAFNPAFDKSISPYEASPAVPRTITKTIPIGAQYPDGDIVVSRFYTPNKYGTTLTTPWRDDDRTVMGIENEARNLTDMLWYNEDGSLQGLYLWRWNEKEQVMDPFYQFYTEGPWIYRRKDADGNAFGKYYAFFAVDYQEQLVYATTDSLMDATWEFQGLVLPYSNTAITRHPTVFDWNGKTYLGQHDGSLPFGSGHRRAINLEELNFDENGLIVSSFRETSTGLTGTTSWIQDNDGDFITHESFRTDRNGFYVSSTPTTRRTYPIITASARAIGLNMESNGDKDDSRWEIIQGTSDPSDPTLISIESWNHPGLFLKVDGNNIILSARSTGNSYPSGSSAAETIATMQKETTFKTVRGLNGKEGTISFESMSRRGMYISIVETAGVKALRLTDGTDKDACSFTVTSRAALKDISASKEKTAYSTGEELNLDDITVTAIRQGGATDEVEGFSVDASGVDMNVAGKQTITVSYQEDNFHRTFDLEITVDPETDSHYVMAYTKVVGTTGSSIPNVGFYDNSLHLAYSANGVDWTALNDNKGMLFYSVNASRTNAASLQFKDPFIFRKPDGTYVLLATAVRYNNAISDTSIIYWDSKDLVNWENQKLIAVSSGTVYPTAPQAIYNGADNNYTIIWKQSGSSALYYNTVDASFASPTTAAEYTGSDYNPTAIPEGVDVLGAPAAAIVGSIVSVPERIIAKLNASLGTPVIPVGADAFDVSTTVGKAPALPSSGNIKFSDGSTEERNIIWETGYDDPAKYAAPGTVTVTGRLEGTPDYINPLNKNGADPDILKGPDGKYYFTSSYMDYSHNGNADYQYDRICIRQADTIQGLSTAEERQVFTRKTGNVPGSYHIWAPEIHYIKFAGEEVGTWVIYFAAARANAKFDLKVYALVCDSQDPMTGTWSDMIEMAGYRTSGNTFDLDATVFEHNNEWYMIWASKPNTSNLVISKMIDATTLVNPVGGAATIATPTFPWENRNDRVLEGATIMKANGKIFLGYAAGSTDATYCLGLMYADDSPDTNLLDPKSWTKVPYPLMISNPATKQYGPGHATFSVAEDGVTPILSYMTRPNEGYSSEGYSPLYDATRYARIAIIYFHEDGTPYFGIPPVDGYLPGSTVTATIEVNPVTVPEPDLLWYQFDETSGNTAADSSGKGLNGTRNGAGAAFASPGVSNGYMSLNAGNENNGYVTVPNAAITGVTDFTISTWVKLDAYDMNMKVFDFGNGTGRRMSFTVSSGETGGNMTYLIKTNTTNNLRVINTPTYFRVGKWTHLAITQSGQLVTIYVDGVPVASLDGVVYNPSSLTSPNSNYIGRSSISYDRYFRGGIDDFRMYSKALSEEQILALTSQYAAVIDTVDTVSVDVFPGETPVLPSMVKATMASGGVYDVAVKWDQPTASQIAGTSSYTVYGFVSGYSEPVVANVRVLHASVDISVSDNRQVDFSIDITEAKGASRNVLLICAAYAADGRLLSVVQETETIVSGVPFSGTLSVPLGVNPALVKGFVWSADSYVPLVGTKIGLDLSLSSVNINGNLNDVRDNLTLPMTTQDGLDITWRADPAIISTEAVPVANYDPIPAGVITRGETDTSVKLTATVTKNGVSASKTFDLVVKAKPVANGTADELGAYLYMGFKNLSGDKQQIYFATSQDGFIWSDFLNGGNPILTSKMGAHGLRDPHIVRSPHGDKFYIVATDLDSNPGEWYRYANFGSTSIMIWESTDLINWSEQRMVDIGPAGAGCVWAPESMYDEKTGEYLVYFSAHMNGINVGGAVGQKNVWICKTRDFITFSEPEVFVAPLPGTTTTGVIDTTMIQVGDMFYRYTKNENGNRIFSEYAPQILHTTWTRVNPDGYIIPVSGRAYEGPAIYKVNNENKWCLMLDEYSGSGARRYTPFVSTDLSSEANFQNPATGTVRMPQDARACHGVVLPITNGEYSSIMAKWPVN